MNITRVNPDWQWVRATSATVKDGEINLGEKESSWRPSYESPALHRTLANTFDDILSSHGQNDTYIQAFIRRFGPLGAPSDISFEDNAAEVWWVTRALDAMASFNPNEITISQADQLKVDVPNPLRIVPPPQQEVTHVGDDGATMTYGRPSSPFVQMAWNMVDLTAEDEIWNIEYSYLVGIISDLINNRLIATSVRYESLWNFKRDRHGVRRKTEGFDAPHRFQRALVPNHLLAYIWLCIADQFEAGNTLDYYKCAEYENGFDCRQELIKKAGASPRREYCGEGCRARAKRRRDAK